jgi:DNA-binding response OmpR family regulator
MRVLLVEDDWELAEFVRKGLEEEGYVVQVCFDGSAGLKAAELTAFDIIVLDVMLPFLDGLEVTRRLRFQNIRTPILLLTARDAPEVVVRGLDAGADDYLTKPFSFDVLLARIRARTRSRSFFSPDALTLSNLMLGFRSPRVRHPAIHTAGCFTPAQSPWTMSSEFLGCS